MKSFREWKRGHVAEKKGALEELRLAIDYYKGNGLPQSYEQAIAWAKKALEHGETRAKPFLEEMERFYAAVKGDADVAYSIALDYFYGSKNLRKDYEQAQKFAELALKNGHKSAGLLLEDIEIELLEEEDGF